MPNILFCCGRPRAGWLSPIIILIALVSSMPVMGSARAQSLAAVPVRYDAVSNTIYIGEDYTDPALIAYPSAPGAPKSPITIPQVAAALNDPALLQDQGGGAWLLNASVVILASAELDATSSTISWLRLASAPSFIRVEADGGYLKIQNIKLTSWDPTAGAVDSDYADGRAYLLTRNGGRMTVSSHTTRSIRMSATAFAPMAPT